MEQHLRMAGITTYILTMSKQAFLEPVKLEMHVFCSITVAASLCLL
jgi:hypothetical protein